MRKLWPVVLLLLVFLPLPERAQNPIRPDAVANPEAVANLDQRIEQTLAARKYAWVKVTTKNEPAKKTAWGPLLAIRHMIDRVGDGVNSVLQSFVRWLDRVLSQGRDVTEPPDSSKPARIPVWLLAGLGMGALAVTALLLLRRNARQPVEAAGASAPHASARIDEEETLANELPEQEWLRLADDYFQQGNGRLAVRALHLAQLAVLAERGLVTISAFKTTADYRAELRRRSRSQAATELFARNGLRYESTWYGWHEASRALIESFGHDLAGLRELTHA